MSILRVRLLGGLALQWDDAAAPPIPSAAARSLFAYLVTYRDRPHTRDLLAGTFWPDSPDKAARRRLSRALWEIRRTLHPHPVLVTPGDAVQLNPDLPLWLDVKEFEQQAGPQTTRLGSKQQDAALAAGNLLLAAELYRGEFLAGYYDNWILVERERLHGLFLAALTRLVEVHKGRGEYEPALIYARRLAVNAPWREEAHCEVMRLCRLLGRDAEALKQFETCRRLLAEELGVEPAPETAALAREIAGRGGAGVVLDLLPASLPAAPLVVDSAQALELPLIGREQERAELLAHVEALLHGLGGIVLLEGEAGVGKTRLLQTVAHDAAWRGAEALHGAGQEIGPTAPYGPLVEALSGGLSPLRANQLARLVQPIWVQVLSPLLPSLAAQLPDLPPPPELDPTRERERLAAALAQLLAGWAQVKPLLVVLENLHWMGEDILDILARLTPSLGKHGVLIIGSYRGEDARALPGVWVKIERLDRAGVRQRLILRGLDAEATGEMIRRCLGLGTPAPLFETRLFQETRGNPLFVLEALRVLRGEGVLSRDAGGRWGTPWDESTADYAELPLPPAVESIIRRRLDTLSPSLQETICLASVLGERFTFDLLQAAGRADSPTLLAALRELVERRFLDETAADYCFSHDKVRQVAYASMEAPGRCRLHHQAAQAYEALQPQQVATLAHHWTLAGVWDKAADYHRQAGDQARLVHANVEALEHYTQTLAILEGAPDSANSAQILVLRLAREALYGLRGEREAQVGELAALAILTEALDDKSEMVEVALRQAAYAEVTCDYRAAVVSAQRAIALAQDEAKQAEGYLWWGRALWLLEDLTGAQQQLERASTLAQVAGQHQALATASRAVEGDAVRNLGNVLSYRSDYARARTRFEHCLDVYRQIGDRRREAAALCNLGVACWNLDEQDLAMDYHEQGLAIYRQIGDRWGEGLLLGNIGSLYNAQGEYATAQTYLEQGVCVRREIGDRRGEAETLTNLALATWNLGDYAGARTQFEKALLLCREIGNQRMESLVLANLARVSCYLENHTLALEYARQSLSIARAGGDRYAEGYALTYLGHTLAGLGASGQARDAYQQAITLRQQMGAHSLAMESLAGLARVTLTQGDAVQALAQVREILVHLESEGLYRMVEPFQVYMTCYHVLQVNDDARASEVLTTAYKLLQEQAAKIPDEAARCSYLENIAAHRELVALYQERCASRTITVRLPRAGAPLGRPLRDDELVAITWTVHVPQDNEIADKTVRRRHRLQRLLAEAQAQGTAPTEAHLAEALGVSRRTVERDVAALRQAAPRPLRFRKPQRSEMSE